MLVLKGKSYRILKEELTRSVGAQHTTGDQWKNNSRKNEGTEPKQKQYPVVDVTGDKSKVQCCKEQYCIGTWNVRSMNQGKFLTTGPPGKHWEAPDIFTFSHACGATQDGRVMVERSDRMWSTGEGNGKPLQYSCLENTMNSMKRQNDRILKEELPRSLSAQYATGD